MTYLAADRWWGWARRPNHRVSCRVSCRTVLYRTLELTLAPALRLLYRPEIVGFEFVPRTGPVIIAGNHISFADEFFTPLAARRQVFYFAKAEYFNTPGLQGRAMAAFFQGLGQVSVERGDARSAAASIDVGVDLLRDGRALGIYPEGTRSPDGRLYKFRTGVARVALRSGAPVVPVGLIGTRDVQPPDSKRWHKATVGCSLRRTAGLLRPRGRGTQFARAARDHRADSVSRAAPVRGRNTSTRTRAARNRKNDLGLDVTGWHQGRDHFRGTATAVATEPRNQSAFLDSWRG